MKITIIKTQASFLVSFLQNRFPQLEWINACDDEISGIASIRLDQPDIAIVDMDITGLSSLKEIKNNAGHPELKFFLMSEWQTFGYEAKQFGAQVFLTKPFSMEIFMKEMERMFAAIERKKRKISVAASC